MYTFMCIRVARPPRAIGLSTIRIPATIVLTLLELHVTITSKTPKSKSTRWWIENRPLTLGILGCWLRRGRSRENSYFVRPIPIVLFMRSGSTAQRRRYRICFLRSGVARRFSRNRGHGFFCRGGVGVGGVVFIVYFFFFGIFRIFFFLPPLAYSNRMSEKQRLTIEAQRWCERFKFWRPRGTKQFATPLFFIRARQQAIRQTFNSFIVLALFLYTRIVRGDVG